MYLGTSAERLPDKPALIFAETDQVVTYGELEARSNQIAQAFRAWGLGPGDGVAVVLGNEPGFLDVFWGALRAGLYFTPVNWHLAADEVEYIVQNSDAKVLFASSHFADLLAKITERAPNLRQRIVLGGSGAALPGFAPFEEAIGRFPTRRIDDEVEGATMLYSSGTTGRPKGVRPPLGNAAPGAGRAAQVAVGFSLLFGFVEGDVYLSPGPLYHAAPLIGTTTQQAVGATAVILEKFHPERALEAIERYRVTSSQWVPTHFSRMLALPEDVRRRYDLSTHRVALHAAAPCPISVKEKMIEWWGPILCEYYAGTEGGGTLIRSDEWLDRKGSVGRHWAGGKVWILDEKGDGISLPRVDGTVYFEGPEEAAARFRYYKDDQKTDSSYVGRLFTLGDVGHLDEEGYLYLTDRKSHMIISGGVNIYPQEVESCLAGHDAVEDVAVIGVPNEDMGEEVKAVVQLCAGREASAALEEELIEHVRARIARFKAPRSVDFVADLPRQENGKIYKRLLRDRYWLGHGSKLV